MVELGMGGLARHLLVCQTGPGHPAYDRRRIAGQNKHDGGPEWLSAITERGTSPGCQRGQVTSGHRRRAAAGTRRAPCVHHTECATARPRRRAVVQLTFVSVACLVNGYRAFLHHLLACGRLMRPHASGGLPACLLPARHMPFASHSCDFQIT